MTTKVKTRGTMAPPLAEKAPPINNTALVDAFRAEGGRVMHINDRRRSLTVAFKTKSGHIDVATAVVHRSDTFKKKIGTKTAIEHFNAGRVVSLPISVGKSSQAAIDYRLQVAMNFLGSDR